MNARWWDSRLPGFRRHSGQHSNAEAILSTPCTPVRALGDVALRDSSRQCIPWQGTLDKDEQRGFETEGSLPSSHPISVAGAGRIKLARDMGLAASSVSRGSVAVQRHQAGDRSCISLIGWKPCSGECDVSACCEPGGARTRLVALPFLALPTGVVP